MVVRVHLDANVPSWEDLPYECQDDFCKSMLPACVAAGIIQWSNDEECRLHDSQRTNLQTQGTLRELLDILSAWTCPVKWWEITTQTSVLESLEEFSQELQKVWEEISRVFALSNVLWPGDVRIAFHVEGLGNLSLNTVKGTCSPHVSLPICLIVL